MAPADRPASSLLDVVVVGAGPTGLTAAHLCRRAGLSVAVVERRDGPLRAPAAHAVNARSFEVWRQAGVDVDSLRTLALDPAEAGRVHWATVLGGEILGSLSYERQGDEVLAITPTPLRNLSQHRLEPALAQGVDVRWSTTCLGVREGDAEVEVDVEGAAGRQTLRARHVIAADGAGSGIRRAAGIEMEGPRGLQTFLMLHLAADFTPLTGAQPGVLWFLVDPRAGATFVSHGAEREWVCMHPWGETAAVPDPSDPAAGEIVRAALADPSLPFEVLGTSVWHMSAQLAASYGSSRVHLAGDAAHRFPPTGGLGLNTGVADVHNLVWKIAGVEAGRLDPSWLDTYEAERRPVARLNGEQSLTNAFRLVEVAAAIGLSGDVDASVAALEATLADPQRRAAVVDAIAGQAAHFDLFGLQLGHTYDGPGVLPDGTPPDGAADPVRDYVPSSRPGGRLPHAWLSGGRSTLDLVDPVLPTVLVPEGSAVAVDGDAVVGAVPGAAWTVLGVAPGHALVVRPDQHVYARVPLAEVVGALDGFVAAGARR